MIYLALQLDGYAFFKESVQPNDGEEVEGQHGYKNRTREEIENLFEEAGFDYS